MDFFDRQDRARQNTRKLVVYFAAGVVLLTVAIYFALLLIFAGTARREPGVAPAAQSLWNPELLAWTAAGTVGVITFGSLFKTMQLSRGGSSVATMLGGRLVNPATTDPHERRLLNVVEEMALASGLPVPQVYVMDREPGINAFAAGFSTSDAVVGVTRGCITLLNRDELQGVIGHEFSHILNGDMRLNLRLMGWIFGIFCIAVIGRVLLYTRTRSREKNPLPLLGLVFLALGSIGVFFGRLIQAAVSRQREYLADAAAVQFTRNPAGLAGALKKIGGLAEGSKLEAAHATEASHLFFGNGVGAPLFGMLATHPPLAERIRAIDPSFDGTFPKVSSRVEVESRADEERAGARRGGGPIPFPFEVPGLPRTGTGSALPPVLPPGIAAAAVMPHLGEPTPAHLEYAVRLRESFPRAIQEAAHDPFGACALVFALLLSSDSELRSRQLVMVESAASGTMRQEVEKLLRAGGEAGARAKLPLVDLALPALRDLSPAQYEQFAGTMRQLIESDREIDLFEYVLQKIVVRHLEPQFRRARKAVVQFYVLKPLASECAVLLSALSHVGSTVTSTAITAFQKGAAPLSRASGVQLQFVPPESCGLLEIDQALTRLDQAAPQVKKQVLNACALVVAADGVIQETEAELLRGIADALDCPIPPFIP